MNLKEELTKELLEELELKFIEQEIEKGTILDDGAQGCLALHVAHSMNFTNFRTLLGCQTVCPKYLICRKKILERRTQNTVVNPFLEEISIERDLAIVSPILSKYGISLSPAPIHHYPPWEKLIVIKTPHRY